ncbi:MAG: hypothetical protein H0Z29_07650 [Candidatus Marinimicrobia bacterium]|nr:hypothetical protein [Candidatus Neomarinimicrobiota bacterium]
MKKAILICTCSFACPSMKDIDFAELSEKIRLEIPEASYMVLHPRICERNGEEMMADLLKEGVIYYTIACKPEKQEKLLRDGFQKAGVIMERDKNWVPISVQFKNTDQVFEEIERALKNGGE